MKRWASAITASIIALGIHQTALADSNTVYLYTWTEYVPEGLLDDFTKQTGIKVNVSSLESNEVMYAKLKTMGDAGGYDVIAPTNYFVGKMAKEGMLMPLDHSKLPVIKELDPNMLDKDFDKGNKWSLPQLLGATGIAYNTEIFNPDDLNSWGNLWDPKYKNQLQILDDAREVFNIALLKLGEDPNTTDPKIIKKAYEELLKLRPNVLAFTSDNPSQPFVAGEVDLGQIWNGSVYMAKQAEAPIEIKWPKEGTVLWVDNLAIPKTSKNPDNAHKLINYLLSAPVAAKLAKEIGYPITNLEARKLLPKEMVEDPSIYPPEDVFKNSVWQNDVGNEAIELYESYFQKLKATK